MAKRNIMNEEDRQKEKYYQSEYQRYQQEGNQEGMDWAHSNAETLRNKYGYSGGSDGSQFNPLGYTGKHDDQINASIEKLTNQQPFTYDYTQDPLYQQYEQAYRREGDRARENTLADYAASTGGQVSSWAVSAANQAQNYYNQQLADKIPELQQLAYQMYQDQISNERNNLNDLLTLDANAQNRWLNNANLLNYLDETQYSRDYQAQRDAITDARYDSEIAYQKERDAISDQRYEDETAYNREMDRLQMEANQNVQSFAQAIQKWQLTGTLDEQSAKVLGLPAGISNTDYRFALAQEALQREQFEHQKVQDDRQNALSWASVNNSRAAQSNSQRSQQWNQAMEMWQASGSSGASEAVARVLGIEPGTVYGGPSEEDVSYRAGMYLEMMQSENPEQWIANAEAKGAVTPDDVEWLFGMLGY